MNFKSGFESRERVAVKHSRRQWVPSQRCGSAERSSGKWCPSKLHAQQWNGRRSSVACTGAQRRAGSYTAEITSAESRRIGWGVRWNSCYLEILTGCLHVLIGTWDRMLLYLKANEILPTDTFKFLSIHIIPWLQDYSTMRTYLQANFMFTSYDIVRLSPKILYVLIRPRESTLKIFSTMTLFFQCYSTQLCYWYSSFL